MKRLYNFGAGPAVLPEEVLKKASKDLISYSDTGMGISEISHRSEIFKNILNEAKNDIKELMGLGEDFEILFLQGGASTVFDLIPMNFLHKSDFASFIDTGRWTKRAMDEAKFFAKVQMLASSEKVGYREIPDFDIEKINPKSKYLYICTNNTIYGTRFIKEKLPKSDLPLIGDMSSHILSETYPYKDFDLFFASTQKNLGPSGLTIVGVKKSFLQTAKDNLPAMLSYKFMAEKNSLYNTPPTFNIYFLGQVLKWIKENDGLEAIEKLNKEKAKILYEYIDNSNLFRNEVEKEDRSLMNVVFTSGNKNLDYKFIKNSEARGLLNLQGHRSFGGMRASIYNGMGLKGVKVLVDFMKNFEIKNK